MAPMPVQRASDGAAFVGRTARGQVQLVLTIPLLLLAAVLVAPVHALVAQQVLTAAGSTANLTPDQLKAGAADLLEQRTAKGGAGYSFEISQTSTITSRPDGPPIEVPDPIDPAKSLGFADRYLFYSLIERGIVTPDGFWSELRVGPEPGDEPDFEKAELRRSALMKSGVGWRNDRDGWYQADVLPGIGLDPATAGLLPSLLRNATEATDTGNVISDGASLRNVAATGTESDIPGLVAADGVDYTRLTGPIEFGFDDQGRLVRIHAVALNTTMADFALVVDTVITFDYDHDPGSLPDPEPTWQPMSAAQDEGGQ